LRLADDIAGMVRKAIDVDTMGEDLAEHGRERTDLVTPEANRPGGGPGAD